VGRSRTPLDERSNQELEGSLIRGEFGPRREAIVQGILRRRYSAATWARLQIHLWLSTIMTALGIGGAALRRFWGRR
jgi:hypothetical protein